MSEVVVLVTGGTGLVGNGIREVVERDEMKYGDRKFVFLGKADGDLSDYNQAKLIFEKYKPTFVIHLAAKVGGLYDNMNENLSYLRENVAINDNVLRLCHEFGVVKVVSCLSTCIFPDKTTYPIDELMLHNGEPHSSNYGFCYAKRLIDVLNRAYHQKNSRIFTSVIPCNTFGPNDNFAEYGHVIPGLINRMNQLIRTENGVQQKDKSFVVYGSGRPLRQFIYSIDLAKLILWMFDNWNSIDPIILAIDEEDEVTIAQAAKSVAKALKFEGKIVFDTKKSDGVYKKTASNAKMRELLPDFKFTPFDIAIQQSVDWYLKNIDKAKRN